MFNRYWRSYPWWMQLIQLILMIFILFSFFVLGLGNAFIPRITGVSLEDLSTINENSTPAMMKAVFILQALFSASVFLVPALLFSYFTHPRPAAYLGLRVPGKPIQWLLVAGLMLGAIPVFLQIESWIKMIPWGADVKAQQERYEDSVNAMLKMPDLAAFFRVFFVMALLPAFGEELLFRGVLMRFAAKRSRGMAFPIFVSALMFALFHANIFGGFSIFLAGVILALVYYLTGSIWCSILAHLLNNGLQVVLMYLSSENKTINAVKESEQLPFYIPLGGLVLFIVCLYGLLKEKTPLSPGWSNDYTQEELSENAV